jgi:hypothetical protein
MSLELPKQLIVLPRGLQADGSATLPTRLCGVSAAEYYQRFGADVVLMPGGRTFLADDPDSDYSDAVALREAAFEAGLPESVDPDLEPSTDTVTNLLSCMPFIDRSESVAFMAQPDHMARGLWASGLVLAMNNIHGFAAMGSYNKKANLQEWRLLLLYKLMFLGVSPGDANRILSRNLKVQQVLLTGKTAIKGRLINAEYYQ